MPSMPMPLARYGEQNNTENMADRPPRDAYYYARYATIIHAVYHMLDASPRYALILSIVAPFQQPSRRLRCLYDGIF